MIKNHCQNVELQEDQRKENENLILHSVGCIHADFLQQKGNVKQPPAYKENTNSFSSGEI